MATMEVLRDQGGWNPTACPSLMWALPEHIRSQFIGRGLDPPSLYPQSRSRILHQPAPPSFSESFVHIAGCFLRDSFPEGGLQLQGAETRPRLSTWIAKLLSNLHSCQRTRILVQNALLVSQQSHFTHRGGPRPLKSQARVFQAPPFPAAAASPENLLEMQIWRPRPSPPESETPGVGPAVWKQALGVLVVPAQVPEPLGLGKLARLQGKGTHLLINQTCASQGQSPGQGHSHL